MRSWVVWKSGMGREKKEGGCESEEFFLNKCASLAGYQIWGLIFSLRLTNALAESSPRPLLLAVGVSRHVDEECHKSKASPIDASDPVSVTHDRLAACLPGTLLDRLVWIARPHPPPSSFARVSSLPFITIIVCLTNSVARFRPSFYLSLSSHVYIRPRDWNMKHLAGLIRDCLQNTSW